MLLAEHADVADEAMEVTARVAFSGTYPPFRREPLTATPPPPPRAQLLASLVESGDAGAVGRLYKTGFFFFALAYQARRRTHPPACTRASRWGAHRPSPRGRHADRSARRQGPRIDALARALQASHMRQVARPSCHSIGTFHKRSCAACAREPGHAAPEALQLRLNFPHPKRRTGTAGETRRRLRATTRGTPY